MYCATIVFFISHFCMVLKGATELFGRFEGEYLLLGERNWPFSRNTLFVCVEVKSLSLQELLSLMSDCGFSHSAMLFNILSSGSSSTYAP